jgi:hypothetical protein
MNRPRFFYLALFLGLLSAGTASRATQPSTSLFKVAQQGRMGFISPKGTLVAPPRYSACAGAWSEGHLWVVEDLPDGPAGNFIHASGRELLEFPAAPHADELVGVTPAFLHGRALVLQRDGSRCVVATNGLLAPGLDRRDADIFPFARNGSFGFMDWSGREIISPRFEAAQPFEGFAAPARSNGLWGLVGTHGEWLLEPSCNRIEPGLHGFWIGTRGDQTGILHPSGSWVHEPAFREIGPWGPTAVAVRKRKGWTLLNLQTGQTPLPALLDEVLSVGRQSAWARHRSRIGLVGLDGSLRQPFVYDSVLPAATTEEFWIVRQGGTQGLVDAGGALVLPCRQRSILPLTDNLFQVRTDKGTGLFDATTRKWAVPAVYDNVLAWEELPGAAVRIGSHWGWAAPAEEALILPAAHDELRPWHHLILARKGNLFALFAPDGLPMLPWSARCRELPDPDAGFVNGFGRIVCNGQAGLIDPQGVIRLPCRYQDAGIFSEGLVSARANNQWGFVDLNGQWIIPPQFSQAMPFFDGLAAVQQEDRFGFIDNTGAVRIPFQYQDAGQAFHGAIPVARELRGQLLWGLIDYSGQALLPLEYEALEWVDYGLDATRIHGSVTWLEL